MRAETVIQTVKEVLKQPPAIAKDRVRRAFLCFHLQFYFRNDAVGKIFFVQQCLLNYSTYCSHECMWPSHCHNKNNYLYLQWLGYSDHSCSLLVAVNRSYLSMYEHLRQSRTLLSLRGVFFWSFRKKTEARAQGLLTSVVAFFTVSLLLSLWMKLLILWIPLSCSQCHFLTTYKTVLSKGYRKWITVSAPTVHFVSN